MTSFEAVYYCLYSVAPERRIGPGWLSVGSMNERRLGSTWSQRSGCQCLTHSDKHKTYSEVSSWVLGTILAALHSFKAMQPREAW